MNTSQATTAAEQSLARVLEVVETYESCGPKRQCTRDVLAAVRAAALAEPVETEPECPGGPGEHPWLHALIAEHASHGFSDDGCPVYVAAVALSAALADQPVPPCPVCGGSIRFCGCMDDPFAPVPDAAFVGAEAELARLRAECQRGQSCTAEDGDPTLIGPDGFTRLVSPPGSDGAS